MVDGGGIWNGVDLGSNGKKSNSQISWNLNEEFVFKRLWNCAAPSKVRAFVWQMLLGRVPTKTNLLKRRMITTEQVMCVFCGRCPELEIHLFLSCDGAFKVWCDIMRWLGYCMVSPPNLMTSFAMWITCSNNKRERNGMALVWCACVWVLWKVRNNCVFNNLAIELVEVIDQVKLTSWQWFIGRMAKSPCLLYEWQWGPLM
jgi:hypothetical protein